MKLVLSGLAVMGLLVLGPGNWILERLLPDLLRRFLLLFLIRVSVISMSISKWLTRNKKKATSLQ